MTNITTGSFSGRKFAVIALVSTYCFVIVGSVILTMMKIMSVDVLVALIAGLAGMVMYIVKAYYDDKERLSPVPAKETTPSGSATLLPILAIFLALGMLLPAASMAETTPVDLLKKVPSIKTGIGYSIVDSKINFLSTFTVAEYKNFNLELGYAGDSENSGDKVIAVVSYKVIALRDYLSVPVLDLIECNIGAYYGVGNIGAGNEQDYGATATAIKWKF